MFGSAMAAAPDRGARRLRRIQTGDRPFCSRTWSARWSSRRRGDGQPDHRITTDTRPDVQWRLQGVSGTTWFRSRLRCGFRGGAPSRHDLLCDHRVVKTCCATLGAFVPDDAAMSEAVDALALAESGDNFPLARGLTAREALLVHRGVSTPTSAVNCS